MESLDEWNFEVRVERGSTLTFDRAEAERLMDAMTAWAEEREYGIGGGFRQEGNAFVYRFGFCITRDDDRIPASDCDKLVVMIHAWLHERGHRGAAQYRPFTEEDGELIDLDELLETIDRSIN
ncbi:MAG TPA: hypothetical protein VGF48_24720 [Thermoanaerobaculia bacterium]|jgi:hypothetical protein